MSIFINQNIGEIQTWKAWKSLKFDADASPEAWEHYKQYYSEAFEAYAICSPTFFTHVASNRYIPEPGSDKHCRLYALLKGTMLLRDKKGNEYYQAVSRLSGETDFNFNERHYPALKSTLEQENEWEYLGKLEECKKQHHCLLNFSLMQTMGNMQGFKGKKCSDRLDKFIYHLREFYEADDRSETDIIRYSRQRTQNWESLLEYLNQFAGLADYCKKVYFINDPKLIDDLCVHGQKELDNPKNVKTYIDLACRFWDEKESHFLKTEYDTIGLYFPDGGETYTGEELSYKLMNDLDVNQEEIDVIIKKCLSHGFIHQCGNNCYVR